MIVQIDQSGKLEKTNVPTVIGFSNGKSKALIISTTDKLKLKQHFRAAGKRKAYIYQCFAAIVFLLLEHEIEVSFVIIDTEYPGQEANIKSHLLNFFRSNGREDVDRSTFLFKPIGKASRAHKIVNDAYKGKGKATTISAQQILELVN